MRKIFLCLVLVLLCVGCNNNEENIVQIEPISNTTFFSTEYSDLHKNELKEAYKRYESNYSSYGEYEIYNLTEEEISDKFDIDIFQVRYDSHSIYYLKYNDNVTMTVPFTLNNSNNHCLTNVAITDINQDGFIEVFTSIISYSKNGKSAMSFIQVTDTKTGHFIEITDYDDITYFKENEDGIMSLYNADGIYPVTDDITNGKLDEKYYEIANKLFETPKLNTYKLEFKQSYLEASCDLYDVKITIEDNSINFPYLFENTYTPPYFKISVEMTYLGETFSYVNGDDYLDGATITFVNENSEIIAEPVFAGDVISPFIIYTGMVIKNDYRYSDFKDSGLYNMVINYSNYEYGINETITINDFLNFTM